MNTPKLQDLTRTTISGSCIKKRYPEFYEYLIKTYSKYNISFKEMMYWHYHGISEHPKCEICGEPAAFKTFFTGYKKYCGQRCANISPEKIYKTKQTNLERYGVENPSQNDEIKEKLKNTNLERYGVENPFSSKEIQNKIKQTNLERYGVENPSGLQGIRDKVKQTMTERYGVDNPMKSESIRNRAIQTNLERYGSEYPIQSESVKTKIKQTNLERYGVCWTTQASGVKDKSKQTLMNKYGVTNPGYLHAPDIIIPVEKLNGKYKYKCPHPGCNKCSDKFYWCTKVIHNDRISAGIELCTNILNPDSWRGSNTSIEQFIKNILNEHNICYECNNRSILNNKELDIYIPDYNMAIECNGVYWHSTTSPNPPENNHHYNKWMKCLDSHIKLITVWQDQIKNKPDVIKSIILSKLGIYDRRLYARKCEIRELSSIECNNFLNNNHLQGSTNSSVRYGLYYNDELVSVMTFGLKRKCMGGKKEWELHRYCNVNGTQIVGGASKLFNYFIKTYKPPYIESFSSNDISNGELYLKLGFERLNSGYGSYWYIDKNMKRYHRYTFRKDRLVQEGFDVNKSESQIMRDRGYYKIYDSGQTKWGYTTKENS